jgi:hypothetical protein
MRELQIELCPDRAERRKRARKIASFSAEKRAKGEIAIYARAAASKVAVSRAKRTPAPKPRPPKKASVGQIDKRLLAKIESLAKKGHLPNQRLTLKLSRAKLTLKGASSADSTISFAASGAIKAVKVSALAYVDRATIAAVLNLREPNNKALIGATAFYLECAGRTDLAAPYYLKAGEDVKQKYDKLFESRKVRP